VHPKFDHTRAAKPLPASLMPPLGEKGNENPIGLFSALTTYLAYAVLIFYGHVRDFFGKLTGFSRYFGSNNRPPTVRGSRLGVGVWSGGPRIRGEGLRPAPVPRASRTFPQTSAPPNPPPPQGYAPLLNDWENFYTRRLYHRIQDCWNRPIEGPPLAGAMRVIKRVSTDGNYTLQCVPRGEGWQGRGGVGCRERQGGAPVHQGAASLSPYKCLAGRRRRRGRC
jgi:hypothetical protein